MSLVQNTYLARCCKIMVSVSDTELKAAMQGAAAAASVGPDTLERALLLCKLSTAAYEANELTVPPVAAFRPDQALAPVSGQIAGLAPVLQHASFAKCGSVFGDLGRQYGIWTVAGLGVVVAFRGTMDAQDVLADIQFQPCQVPAGQHIIEMHGGIHKAAKICCSTIAGLCAKLCCSSKADPLPLYFTGVQHPVSCMFSCCSLVSGPLQPGPCCRTLFGRRLGYLCLFAPVVHAAGAAAVIGSWRCLHVWSSACSACCRSGSNLSSF